MTGLTAAFDNLVGNAVDNVTNLLSGNVWQVLVFVIAIGLLFMIYRFAKSTK